MSFNFGSLQDVKQASTTSYLKPYNIYNNVTIKGTEIKEGTSATGNNWKSLVITFGNDEGIYNHSMFYITSDKDFERGSQDMANGGKRQTPSNWERTRDFMSAVGFAFNPEGFAKLQSVAAKFKTFDELALAFKKIVDAAIDKNPTNMKLVGRNSNGTIYATFANFTGIAQANTEDKAKKNGVNVGEWYTWMVSPFNSDASKLAFTAYEQTQMNNYKNAKPTSMDKVDLDVPNVISESTNSSEESYDFDTLLEGI